MTQSWMLWLFQDHAQFDPGRDGRVPWRKDPLHLMLRMVCMAGIMLFSRHPGDLLMWAKSMVKRRRPLSLPLPWLTFDAIRQINQYLGHGKRIYEYGSGHSTLYWAGLGSEVHSVEDNPGWFELAQQKISSLKNVTVRLAQNEAAYVGSINEVNGDFDVVLVDGAYRLACIDAAVPRGRPGGILVVDNTDWHWFDDVDSHIPAGWRKTVFAGCAPFIGYPSQTTVWVRPDA